MPSVTRTDLPWTVQLADHPLPATLINAPFDVVQTGSRIGLRALEKVRVQALPVGPALCCLTHGLVHIPVAPGTAYRWHAPQTLCRPSMLLCSTTERKSSRSGCLRIWLVAYETQAPYTDSEVLRHQIMLGRTIPARGWAVPDGL